MKQLTIVENKSTDPDVAADNVSIFRSKYANSGLSNYSKKKDFPSIPASPGRKVSGMQMNIMVRPSPTKRMQDRTPSISLYDHSIQDVE